MTAGLPESTRVSISETLDLVQQAWTDQMFVNWARGLVLPNSRDMPLFDCDISHVLFTDSWRFSEDVDDFDGIDLLRQEIVSSNTLRSNDFKLPGVLLPQTAYDKIASQPKDLIQWRGLGSHLLPLADPLCLNMFDPTTPQPVTEEIAAFESWSGPSYSASLFDEDSGYYEPEPLIGSFLDVVLEDGAPSVDFDIAFQKFDLEPMDDDMAFGTSFTESDVQEMTSVWPVVQAEDYLEADPDVKEPRHLSPPALKEYPPFTSFNMQDALNYVEAQDETCHLDDKVACSPHQDWQETIAQEMLPSESSSHLPVVYLKPYKVPQATIDDAIRASNGALMSVNPINLGIRWNPLQQMISPVPQEELVAVSYETPLPDYVSSGEQSLELLEDDIELALSCLPVEVVHTVQTIAGPVQTQVKAAQMSQQQSFSAKSMVDNWMSLRGIQTVQENEDVIPEIQRQPIHRTILEYVPTLLETEERVPIIIKTKLRRYKELVRMLEKSFELLFREDGDESPDIILDANHGVIILPLIMASQTSPDLQAVHPLLGDIMEMFGRSFSSIMVIFEIYEAGKVMVDAISPFSKPILLGLKQLSRSPLVSVKVSMTPADTLSIIQNSVATLGWDGFWKERNKWLQEEETVHERFLCSTGYFNPISAQWILKHVPLQEFTQMSLEDKLSMFQADISEACLKGFHKLAASKLDEQLHTAAVYF